MKILMVLIGSSFPPDIRVEKEARTLIDAGHEVSLACSRTDGQRSQTRHNGIHILRFDYPGKVKCKIGSLQFYTTLFNSYWLHSLTSAISQIGADAVHVHDLGGVSYSALVAAKRQQCKTVLDLHENWPPLIEMYAAHGQLPILQRLVARLRFWSRYERSCLRLADHVVVTAHGMKERIVNLGIPNDKISVVMNLEDVNRFLSLPVQADIIETYRNKFVLSYIGKLTFERGIQTVIHAVKLLKDKIPNILFLVVGDGPCEHKFKSMCKKLDISEYVMFTGWVDFEAVRSYMLATDVAVLPQIVNQQTLLTSAHKVFQYMVIGRPLVLTPTQVYTNINKEKNFALFVPYDDPEVLSEAIIRLYEDDALRLRLSENARRLTREKYDWSLMAKNLTDIYSRMCVPISRTASSRHT